MAPTNSWVAFPSPPRMTHYVEKGGSRSFVPLLPLVLFLGACVGYMPIYFLYRRWEAHRLENSNNTSKTPTWTVMHLFTWPQPSLKVDNLRHPSDTLIARSEEPAESTQSNTSFLRTMTPVAKEPRGQEKPTYPVFPQRAVLAVRVSKVDSLSHDRAADIVANPKLAPVLGPLRPLSTENPPYGRQLSTLFLFRFARFKHRSQKDPKGSMGKGQPGSRNKA
ncbi:hypothetical protein V8B97DRAFT_1588941 [Scleroderma yunnanense]